MAATREVPEWQQQMWNRQIAGILRDMREQERQANEPAPIPPEPTVPGRGVSSQFTSNTDIFDDEGAELYRLHHGKL